MDSDAAVFAGLCLLIGAIAIIGLAAQVLAGIAAAQRRSPSTSDGEHVTDGGTTGTDASPAAPQAPSTPTPLFGPVSFVNASRQPATRSPRPPGTSAGAFGGVHSGAQMLCNVTGQPCSTPKKCLGKGCNLA